MFHIHYKSCHVWLGLLVAMLWGIMLAVGASAAPPPMPDGPRSAPSDFRQFHDMRHNHDRMYPAPNTTFRALPQGHRTVIHNGTNFYFADGAWYRARGSRFIVVAPPIGLFVPFLPPFYSIVWALGVPYYYANEVYYMNQGDGYVVVNPPTEGVSETPPSSEKMFIYPRQGQSEKQQANDRYACHQWAVSQTGFDPTHTVTASESKKSGKSADYLRAMSACLEGKGYTVK